MESLSSFYETLPTLVKFLVDYVIVRGLIMAPLAAVLRGYIGRGLTKTERDAAIRLHYINKALDKGHQCKLKDCDEDKCVLF